MPGEAVFYDLADGAMVVEYQERSDEEANRDAVTLARALMSSATPGLYDAIPGARTLFLVFDPRRLSSDRLKREILSGPAGLSSIGSQRKISIGVAYGGEMGPDLEDLARSCGLTSEEFSRRHSEGDYTVAFLGFAPGFAYLTGLDPALHARRLPAPRPRVPAGSVAIGGPYTGVYPSPTPGGWRLIGRSAIRLFDEEGEPPNLLRPGDRVRFEPMGRAELERLQQEIAAASSRSDTSPGGRPIFRIVKPGLFTSVQGAPCFGRGGSGLPPGGAMDEGALASGNSRLGNSIGLAALEITLLGPELEAMSEVRVCLQGDVAVEHNGAAVEPGSVLRLAAGDRLRCGPVRGAARACLCVEGGVMATGRLGLTRPLEAGQILMAARREPSARGGLDAPGREVSEGIGGDTRTKEEEESPVRVVLDPRRERFFEAPAIEQFLTSSFRVSSMSDRRGIRLEGTPLPASGSSEMPPEGTALGTIQVPAGGQPILLGPDRPITGGYARLGTVISADWARLARIPPGRTVRFAAATLAEALEARSSIWRL
ncbi:MAG TPA: 5-oxoprolinase subunit PxpB [Thermoanaerobaculia bacterium]|nr:5-oxoprolinase subunit PxpB [Thermoanaerobaculia bacterium]